MRFPSNTSLDEMRNLLIQLREEYMPDENHLFLNELDEESCNLVLELVTIKDQSKRDELRQSVDEMIIQWRKNIDTILHQAQNVIWKFREKVSQDQDNNNIVDLDNLIQDL